MPAPVKAPRLPVFKEPVTTGSGDLTGLEADGRAERLLFVSDDAAGVDLEDAVFTECHFRAVSLQGAPMTRVTFGDCLIEEVNAPVLEAPDSGWWNTAVIGGRIGSAELYGATFRSVRFERAKLGYLNLRRAKIKDVEFRDVHIEELDAGGANLERVSFIDCTIDTLALNGAKLKDVDLRGARLRTLSGISALKGATVSFEQLLDLAPILANELGLRVE
ncbi:pentapeptide repeat-containing protein [Paeniglutamicibacter gangotriensis]|uniref:pentapeptide repeat-containing protein n=1 Tax=Paeniglutamicibacter gangotriensis TaxID=254787 RepID=UPI0037C625BF